jgi:hypothetical protein
MFHELRENCLANIHPSLSAMMRKYPDRCRELFLARKSSNGKILKTGLTHYISNPWREFTIRLPDSSGAKYKRTKGAIKLHLLLDHDGYLPSFAVVTEGKTSEIRVARTLRFDPGTILAIDRGYIDYEWFRELTGQEVYFVTRMKEKAVFAVQEDLEVPQNSNVVSDQIVWFPRLAREGEAPVLFRRVEICDEEKGETIVFLSNLLGFGATTIAAIYKDRWQVELFFKALKQTLKIKTFVGTSANAVRTQVWTALIAMLVLKYLQLKSTFSWSLSTLAALLRQQLFFYRDLWLWLNDPFQAPPALVGVHDDAQQLAITW